MKQRFLALLNGIAPILACCLWSQAYAEGLESQKNIAMMEQQQIALEGGFTMTLQHTDTSGVDNELLGSFDMVSTLPAGSGEVVVYVEGNTSPLDNGVASNYEEANGDAGSALDRDGRGRFQVSEFYYTYHVNEHRLLIGLLDPAASLDASDVANDETSQFLGSSFVNNPTIGMPDYTLGIVYHIDDLDKRPGITLMAASSHGLGDNTNASYSELVDVGADGKGHFLAAEVEGQSGIFQWRFGMWLNSADHDYLNGSGKTGSNKGVYLNTDIDANAFIQQSKFNLRVGLADEKVSNAASFFGLSMETPLAGNTLGVGVARTGASSKAGSLSADRNQAEVYVRFDVLKSFQVTPSIQWIENSGLVENPDNRSSIITSLRASYGF